MSEFDKNASLKSLGHSQAVVLLGKVNKGISSNSVGYVQIEDQHRFSVLRIDFNQEHKVVDINMLRKIYAKPDNRRLWLVGIPIMTLVLFFNIFVIVKVHKSSVTRKWAKYLMVIFLNFSVIGCHAMSGFFFGVLSLRMLGVGISSGDYFNTYWSIGLPLGAMIVLWRLKNNLYRTQEDNWIYEVEQGDVSGQSGEEGASRRA